MHPAGPGRRGYDEPVDGDDAGSRPLAEALERVGDRWTLLTVDALAGGARRFNDLQKGLPGIAPNILSQRLKQLERLGLVVTRPYTERPVRLVYELTAAGIDLAAALRPLAQWGARHSGQAELPRHRACGTPMETRWYCPTCARVVEEDEEAEARFV